MTTVLITEREGGSCVGCKHIGARARLVARLRGWVLDCTLAEGACPDASAALSLRAEKLIGPRMRRQLARELRDLMSDAQRPPGHLQLGVPICRNEVLRARDEIEELADYLLCSTPVEAGGVARLRLLLRDGSSALYRLRQCGDLEQALQEVLEALRLRLPVDV